MKGLNIVLLFSCLLVCVPTHASKNKNNQVLKELIRELRILTESDSGSPNGEEESSPQASPGSETPGASATETIDNPDAVGDGTANTVDEESENGGDNGIVVEGEIPDNADTEGEEEEEEEEEAIQNAGGTLFSLLDRVVKNLLQQVRDLRRKAEAMDPKVDDMVVRHERLQTVAYKLAEFRQRLLDLMKGIRNELSDLRENVPPLNAVETLEEAESNTGDVGETTEESEPANIPNSQPGDLLKRILNRLQQRRNM